jgi:hypothetical protein
MGRPGPAHAESLAAYINQHQLNIESQADAVQLLAYPDALSPSQLSTTVFHFSAFPLS